MIGNALGGVVWFAIGSAAFLVVLAVLLWRRREMHGAVPLTIQALLMTGLCMAIAAESATTPTQAPAWFLARDALILPGGAIILWFSLEYASLRRYLSRRLVSFLAGSVVLHSVLYLPDGGRLLWSRLWWEGGVRGELAPLGIMFAAYALLLFVLATSILVVLFVRSPAHRLPVALILAGHVVVRVAYPLTVLKIAELPNEVNLLALDFAALMYTVALLRLRLFDLVPVARQAIIDRMRDAMLVLDSRDRIADVNDAARNLMGASNARLLGRPLGEVAPHQTQLLAALALPDSQVTEIRLKSRAGERAAQVTTTGLTDWQGAPIGRLVQIHDITALRASENRVLEHERALAAGLERERLARDLHDSLGQVLGYVGLQAATIRKLVSDGRPDDVDERLDRLATIAADAQSDVRRTIAELAHSSPQGVDLVASLRSRLAASESAHGIDTSLSVGPEMAEVGIDAAAATQLLRIVDEAVANAIRHGRASLVHVSLDSDATSLALAIEDDGIGFETAVHHPENDGRYGLRFMRERAVELGGDFQIASTPDRGTRVRVRVPRPVAQEAPAR